MIKNEIIRNQIIEYIIETVIKQKPATTKQLIKLIQKTYTLPEEEITNILLQLEAENKIKFNKRETQTSSSNAYVILSKPMWYLITIALVIVTTITVFIIPEDAYPIVYIRLVLGSIFVLFLPGFAFIKAIYPTNSPIKNSSGNLGTIEHVTLSFGVSIALTPIVGIILNFTPLSIKLIPITLTLIVLTVVCATIAVFRQQQANVITVNNSSKTYTNQEIRDA